MKRHAPAAARNSAPIAEVLERELPAQGLVLEIASGSGEHALFLARRFPKLRWQPSDRDGESLASIAAWRKEEGPDNLLPPVEIDAAANDWSLADANAILCVNMIHIAPWRAAEGLFRGAARLLTEGAPLVLYGPFLEADVATAPSNLAFDRSLKDRDPQWGLRRIEDVDELAAKSGFRRSARYEMPANNLVLVYRRG